MSDSNGNSPVTIISLPVRTELIQDAVQAVLRSRHLIASNAKVVSLSGSLDALTAEVAIPEVQPKQRGGPRGPRGPRKLAEAAPMGSETPESGS